MPHIHTEPNQHDITISAYIVLRGEGEDKLLVHMHRKFGKLLQIGGHIELDETPWQTVAHELVEESGYELSELKLLQPLPSVPMVDNAVVHPVPFLMNTHKIGEHYHSDLCYAFVARDVPQSAPGEGESTDLRWVTQAELNQLAEAGKAVKDSTDIYNHILKYIDQYAEVDASKYSLEKPDHNELKFVA